MSAIVVIPARFASTRFPGKPLALLKGLPLIQHVYKNAAQSQRAADILVATDSKEIFDTVLSFGGKAVMTSSEHASGSDRIAEVAPSLNCDIIVNVQGDEPLISPEMIDEVISVLDDKSASIGTLKTRIACQEDIFDPNVVKVVTDRNGFALYFSRAPVPFHRDAWKMSLAGHDRQSPEVRTIHHPDSAQSSCFKHIGIYSYRKDILITLAGLPPSPLELIEKLEQLRALEHGFTIKVRETFRETFGVDTPEDLERIEQCLNSYS